MFLCLGELPSKGSLLVHNIVNARARLWNDVSNVQDLEKNSFFLCYCFNSFSKKCKNELRSEFSNHVNVMEKITSVRECETGKKTSK